MSHLSVADQVNNDIVMELLSVLSSNLKGICDILKAIGVDMEDRSIDCFGKI